MIKKNNLSTIVEAKINGVTNNLRSGKYMDSLEKTYNLYKAFLSLESVDGCERFLEDIMTPKELQDLSDRLAVAQLLFNGKTYEEITERTGMSSTTIARINRTLHHGAGGYKEVLEKKKQEK